MAENVNYEIKGKELVITVDLGTTLRPSHSGKSVLVATTGPGVTLPNGMKLGLNVTKKA